MSEKSKFWHWPDHVIGKRESRRLREEHNALGNSHAELLETLQEAERVMFENLGPDMPEQSKAITRARAAITNGKAVGK